VAEVFATLKDPSLAANDEDDARLQKEVVDKVVELLGPVARPAGIHFVSSLPKTRSGKLLRRSIQALAEGRDPGDLSTLDDPASLEAVRHAIQD
jgi:propionyl-CoA synthetase